MAQAIIEDGGEAGSLFLIQNISRMKRSDARGFMKDYLSAGGGVGAVAQWLRLAGGTLRKYNVKGRRTAGAVVDALGQAAEWVIDRIEDGIDAILESIEAVVDAVLDNFLRAVTAVGRTLRDVYQAAIVETGEEFLREVTLALRRIGQAARQILEAVLEVSGGALGTVISILLNTLVKLSGIIAEELRTGRHRDVGSLLRAVDCTVRKAGDTAVVETWDLFRIVGSPVQAIVA